MDSDDLTASHWDDILAPRENEFNGFGSTYVPPPVTNGFSDLIDSPFGARKDSESDEDEDNENENGENDEENDHPELEHGSPSLQGYSSIANLQQEQLNDIRHTQRSEQTSHLISKLTQDLKESSLEAPEVTSPTRIDPRESLFADKGSPLRLKTSSDSPTQPPSASHLSPRRSSEIKQGHRLFSAPRPRKYSSKLVAKHLAENSDEEREPASADPLRATDDNNEKDASFGQVELTGGSLGPGGRCSVVRCGPYAIVARQTASFANRTKAIFQKRITRTDAKYHRGGPYESW
ncbi:hypothetical protein PGUG_05467 [Meyerozyma guilliermondii ATCC 6260]|uniref:Uncharacterized protein n=1 Tax=Meyerozyma guilliermondii (strain ATCC 6260 / CBS 566 / DSM 6381 / JCM 1539 / NBRC 10279 / NRRL Y-324) TaxID=294746 RepID=A5DQB6_PICGU|nr:uncharacterized protein PGUG_05467 [Meyerozyma guilliermondii ATCC 6260]EDK41369.2 hypothetical protein PGUG_05467 [Meyerozyma guilliermondii ATCC 6260]